MEKWKKKKTSSALSVNWWSARQPTPQTSPPLEAQRWRYGTAPMWTTKMRFWWRAVMTNSENFVAGRAYSNGNDRRSKGFAPVARGSECEQIRQRWRQRRAGIVSARSRNPELQRNSKRHQKEMTINLNWIPISIHFGFFGLLALFKARSPLLTSFSLPGRINLSHLHTMRCLGPLCFMGGFLFWQAIALLNQMFSSRSSTGIQQGWMARKFLRLLIFVSFSLKSMHIWQGKKADVAGGKPETSSHERKRVVGG